MIKMNTDYLYQLYFWFFVISIILFLVFVIVVEVNNDFIKQGTIPGWVWLIFALFLIFLFVAVILYYFSYTPKPVVVKQVTFGETVVEVVAQPGCIEEPECKPKRCFDK